MAEVEAHQTYMATCLMGSLIKWPQCTSSPQGPHLMSALPPRVWGETLLDSTITSQLPIQRNQYPNVPSPLSIFWFHLLSTFCLGFPVSCMISRQGPVGLSWISAIATQLASLMFTLTPINSLSIELPERTFKNASPIPSPPYVKSFNGSKLN